MYKPASLRAFLTAANPELAQDPDRLVVFIDAGNLRATYEPALSFEYAYVLNLVFTDYGLMSLAVIVFMLGMVVWFRVFFLRKMRESEASQHREEEVLP